MAPNLISNPPSCRAKLDILNCEKVKNSVNVRTECVTRHIYGYLLGSEFILDDLPSLNSRESTVLEALRTVSDEFKLCYADTMSELTSSLEVTPETVSNVFLGVSNELFCEGITWSRIATFIVFASELAIQCLHKSNPDSVVENIYDCFLKFTQDCLEKWIQDHGGWEGMIEFANGHKKKEATPTVNDKSSSSTTGWAKSALYGTVRVLGTLAYLANLTNPGESFSMHRS